MPFVNDKHISSYDYKQQTREEVFYTPDHTKHNSGSFCLAGSFGGEIVLFGVFFLVLRFCVFCYFGFFNLPGIHNIPCT